MSILIRTTFDIVCKKCGSKAKLGRYKSGCYFWHKFEKYIKDQAKENAEKIAPDVKKSTNDDLPF